MIRSRREVPLNCCGYAYGTVSLSSMLGLVYFYLLRVDLIVLLLENPTLTVGADVVLTVCRV